MPSNRFETRWYDDQGARLEEIENTVGILETENADLQDFVEQARELLKSASWDDAGDYYDAQQLLAEIDLYLYPPS